MALHSTAGHSKYIPLESIRRIISAFDIEIYFARKTTIHELLNLQFIFTNQVMRNIIFHNSNDQLERKQILIQMKT